MCLAGSLGISFQTPFTACPSSKFELQKGREIETPFLLSTYISFRPPPSSSFHSSSSSFLSHLTRGFPPQFLSFQPPDSTVDSLPIRPQTQPWPPKLHPL